MAYESYMKGDETWMATDHGDRGTGSTLKIEMIEGYEGWYLEPRKLVELHD